MEVWEGVDVDSTVQDDCSKDSRGILVEETGNEAHDWVKRTAGYKHKGRV